MAKRTRFSEYKDRYANYRFELSEEGILLMQCHTDGRTTRCRTPSPTSPEIVRSRS
jgi:hypothetical protein